VESGRARQDARTNPGFDPAGRKPRCGENVCAGDGVTAAVYPVGKVRGYSFCAVMTTHAILNELLETLVAQGRLSMDAWPSDLGMPEDFGLQAADGIIFAKPGTELLRVPAIEAALTDTATGWLKRLELHRAIDSTNQRLGLLADAGSIDGVVCIAELQTEGRGRRGRTWQSPFAGNLALSAGIAGDRPLDQLGGLSLAVGLAVLDCLRTLGVTDLALKWPNDILLGGRKLGGVLIDLRNQPAPASGAVEAVIGVGLNVDVSAHVRNAVDQSLTDLCTEGFPISRNLLAGRLISSLLDYAVQFAAIGFAPMREAFNENHLFHQCWCQINQGGAVVVGRVAGITETGEILLETESGTLAFGAGEVSLRAQTSSGEGCPR